jgi:phenylalanyl-tRNA synthetase alpha chain
VTTAAEIEGSANGLVLDGRPKIDAASTVDALDDIERELLGKASPLNNMRQEIKNVPADERAAAGKFVAAARAELEELVAKRRAVLSAEARAESLVQDRLDLTTGGRGYRRGHLHPVTRVWRQLEDVFVGLGYKVAEGPEVETDWYNFEALNFPPGHPARAMQDTLYVKLGRPEEVLLRTHTSPVQVRVMESQRPPIYSVMPGRAFRRDTLDARHSPVFHQIEGLAVDRGITLGDLLGTIEAFIHALFGPDISARFLPSFFPFTEPSAEFAMTCVFCEGNGCTVCSGTGWVELGGCGMVDPNVFKAVNIDPEEYTGFAFGFGIDRLVQLLYGVDHIKNLWDGDIRFAAQF